MFESYILILNNDIPQRIFHELTAMVAPDKRERIERFHHYRDSQRTLLGEIMIRTLIREKLGLDNSEIVFESNECGKPLLRTHPGFHFNISHSGRYIACVICDKPVGIDVEEITPVDLKIAEKYFADAEREFIMTKPAELRTLAFYQIWTKKESFIKRDGRGLRIPLNSFSVISPTERDVYFHQVYSTGDAVCNVCAVQADAPYFRIMDVDEVIKANAPNAYKSRS